MATQIFRALKLLPPPPCVRIPRSAPDNHDPSHVVYIPGSPSFSPSMSEMLGEPGMTLCYD